VGDGDGIEASARDESAVVALSAVGIVVGVSRVGRGNTPQAERRRARDRVKKSNADKKLVT
jgi:hypothetical protein